MTEEISLAQRITIRSAEIFTAISEPNQLDREDIIKIMELVHDYAHLRWLDGYDRGYEDGCDD